MLRLIPIAVLLSGCGLTFGVEATERVTDVSADPGDAAEFALYGVGVEDDVIVRGGADIVEAHIDTVEWSSGGSDAKPVEAELVRVGDALELQLGGGGETITLRSVEVDIPTTLGANVEVTDGGLTIRDLAAPVMASAERVELWEIAGPARVNATSVNVANDVPLELVATGSVIAVLGADGAVTASGEITVKVTELGIGSLDIISESTDSGSYASVILPTGGAWTISIQSDFGAGSIDVGGELYDSAEMDALPLADGVTVEVNGGGALINVTASSASIVIAESELEL